MSETLIALDLETTGLSPEKDHILEIGAVKVAGGRIQDTYSMFVKEGIEIPPFITELTGITEEMVRTGIPLREAVEGFLTFAGDGDILGHNISFDYGFLKQKAATLDLALETLGIDTLILDLKLVTTLESRSLEAVCCHYGVIQEKKHRAFEDALSAYRVYECMKKEFGETDAGAFCPEPLIYRVKKQSPVTISQKRYLNDLIKYHRIELAVDWETMTKSQASQMIDRILSNYGRIKR